MNITGPNNLPLEMATRLGEYRATNKTRNNQTQWLQEGGKHSLYYNCNGYWFIWPESETDLGGFQLDAVVGTRAHPMGTSSWGYWKGRGGRVGVSGEPVWW